MAGVIGKKIGMTSVFTPDRKSVACTLIVVDPNIVTQVKSEEKDGYSALQLAAFDRKEKNTPAPLKGHFKKANTTPKAKVVEFEYNSEHALGDAITVDIFAEGEFVDVVGISKGKGFQGVVKRHGFAGVGGRTHGQHNRARHPGSIGACSTPSRTFKGTRMGGRLGGVRVMVKNLKVLRIIPEKNLLVVSGAIPGHNGSYVFVEK